jgi:hypothetical protein
VNSLAQEAAISCCFYEEKAEAFPDPLLKNGSYFVEDVYATASYTFASRRLMVFCMKPRRMGVFHTNSAIEEGIKLDQLNVLSVLDDCFVYCKAMAKRAERLRSLPCFGSLKFDQHLKSLSESELEKAQHLSGFVRFSLARLLRKHQIYRENTRLPIAHNIHLEE